VAPTSAASASRAAIGRTSGSGWTPPPTSPSPPCSAVCATGGRPRSPRAPTRAAPGHSVQRSAGDGNRDSPGAAPRGRRSHSRRSWVRFKSAARSNPLQNRVSGQSTSAEPLGYPAVVGGVGDETPSIPETRAAAPARRVCCTWECTTLARIGRRFHSSSISGLLARPSGFAETPAFVENRGSARQQRLRWLLVLSADSERLAAPRFERLERRPFGGQLADSRDARKRANPGERQAGSRRRAGSRRTGAPAIALGSLERPFDQPLELAERRLRRWAKAFGPLTRAPRAPPR
jgi:hypothetical protein